MLMFQNVEYLFSVIDKDSDGQINIDELKVFIQTQNFNIKFENIEDIMVKIDSSKDGNVSFDELKDYIYKNMN